MKVENINNPRDIKTLSIKELNDTAYEIRKFLIKSISETGGHLGSSLGTVELIMAMHYVFDSPKDKLIFDIGHQAYAHKILTGRAKDFNKLRKFHGLSGFLKKNESIHDVWEAGHSSTSLSAAVGYAFERDLNNKKNHVVALIGDGSLTNGMSMEALNHIIELQQKVIIIINDNEMSISPNIGFIDKILKNLEMVKTYDYTKETVKKGLNKIDNSEKITKFISGSKTAIKQQINQEQNFFNILGFKYYGPIDGHDFKELITVFKKAKNYNGPLVIHVKTQKGKGYKPAEINKWHAIAPFDVKTGNPKNQIKKISNSALISETLIQLMERDKNITVISPAMLKGSELENIQEKYPRRVTDVGIAEEHATTMSAALGLTEKKPFLSIYSTFLQRAYDQIFHDIIRQNANVVIGIDHAGLVGADGETHQGIYDISFLAPMQNITIVQGRNAKEIRSLLQLGFQRNEPYAIRYSKGGDFTSSECLEPIQDIEYGSWDKLTSGNKLNIISYGENINELLEEYKNDSKIGVINARFINPLDEKWLTQISKIPILVVEEHIRLGGLGTQILDYYNKQNIEVKIQIQAIDNPFVEQGTVEELRKQEKIDLESVKKKVDEMINV